MMFNNESIKIGWGSLEKKIKKDTEKKKPKKFDFNKKVDSLLKKTIKNINPTKIIKEIKTQKRRNNLDMINNANNATSKVVNLKDKVSNKTYYTVGEDELFTNLEEANRSTATILKRQQRQEKEDKRENISSDKSVLPKVTPISIIIGGTVVILATMYYLNS